MLVRPANLKKAGPRQFDIGDHRTATMEQASLGFPSMQQLRTSLVAAGQHAPNSCELPLPDGSKHLAGAIMDPSGIVAGVLNTLVPAQPGRLDARMPSLLVTFLQGRHIADDDNAGAHADWQQCTSLNWERHAAAIGASIGSNDTEDVSFVLDRLGSPRLLTLQSTDLEVSILLSPCTTTLDALHGPIGFDKQLWTSEAHCRRLGGAGDMLSGLAAKKGTRNLARAALLNAVRDKRPAESWMLLVLVGNICSRKSPQLGVAVYALLAEMAMTLNQGKETSRWQCLMVKHGECLEALGQFSVAAADVYQTAANAAEHEPSLVGGLAYVPNALGNAGLANKRAGNAAQAEALYRRALHFTETEDPQFPPEERQRSRNRILCMLAQLCTNAAQTAGWQQEIFRLAFAMMELAHQGSSCILGWDEGGVPTMRVPSQGRVWRMQRNGDVVEDAPGLPETAGHAMRRASDAARQWQRGPELDAETSRNLLPQNDATSSTCAVCGTVGPASTIKRCAGCRGPSYCGQGCQGKGVATAQARVSRCTKGYIRRRTGGIMKRGVTKV